MMTAAIILALIAFGLWLVLQAISCESEAEAEAERKRFDEDGTHSI
jgi:type II secretory pathway component PulJ